MHLYCERLGAGAPVVVVHGGLGLDSRYLRPWLDPLASTAELLFLDLPGHGRSPRVDSFAQVTHASLVADLDRAREELGLSEFVLLGHSYGAFLAAEYAARHPARLRGLVLVGGAPSADYLPEAMGLLAARATPEQLAVFGHLAQVAALSPEELREQWGKVLPTYFHAFDAARDAAVVEACAYNGEAFLHSQRAMLPTFDVTAGLQKVEVPSLIIGGRADWITPPKQAERLHRLLRGSRLELFERSGHFPFVEEQERFLQVVGRFLEGLEKGDRLLFGEK